MSFTVRTIVLLLAACTGVAAAAAVAGSSGGDAEDTDFVLLDPERAQGHARDEALRHDRDRFAAMARVKRGDQSRLLLKVVGKLKHGGKEVLSPDSAEYRVLTDFVRRLDAP